MKLTTGYEAAIAPAAKMPLLSRATIAEAVSSVVEHGPVEIRPGQIDTGKFGEQEIAALVPGPGERTTPRWQTNDPARSPFVVCRIGKLVVGEGHTTLSPWRGPAFNQVRQVC